MLLIENKNLNFHRPKKGKASQGPEDLLGDPAYL